MRVTKAMLECELELANARYKALQEKLRSQWIIEEEVREVRDANDILTVELEKERQRTSTSVIAERVVTVPVTDPWHRRVNAALLVVVVVLAALLVAP